MRVHLCDLLRGRRTPAPDRPERLIRDRDGGDALGHAPGDLIAAHAQRLAVLPLRLGLADADDRQQPRPPRGVRLGRHHRIRLAVMLAAFGMADDDRGGAHVSQHLRADVSRECAGAVLVAVLPPDGEASSRHLHRAREQRRRRTDQHVGTRRRCRQGGGHDVDLAELRHQSVHLPVAGDQCTHRFLACRIRAHPPWLPSAIDWFAASLMSHQTGVPGWHSRAR
jgi:hypothetical protein